jgi:hypothetical protein
MSVTVYEYREEGCSRCGWEECEVTQYEDEHLCVFCFETHLGNILKHPRNYPGQETLARGIIGAGHVLLNAIKANREPQ